jgi:hypothetical protein
LRGFRKQMRRGEEEEDEDEEKVCMKAIARMSSSQ